MIAGMNTPKTFADVVRGERAVQRIFEDERHLAFLNPSPLRPGHTIVIPKRVADYVFDLEEDEHAELWRVARLVARTLRARLPCERVCVAVVGWEVRHVHIHLVPTNQSGEFPPLPGIPADPVELAAIAERLRA
jgi:histidine triad (HIT) family protein